MRKFKYSGFLAVGGMLGAFASLLVVFATCAANPNDFSGGLGCCCTVVPLGGVLGAVLGYYVGHTQEQKGKAPAELPEFEKEPPPSS